jgi:hypothetical protein
MSDKVTKKFRYSGQLQGNSLGLPYRDGGYNTVRYGFLDHFYRTPLEKGESVDVEGRTYTLTREVFRQGNAHFPDEYLAEFEVT